MTCGFLIQLVFVTSQLRHSLVVHPLLRDGPLGGGGEGGGAAEVQKIFAQGKIKWKKIHARQLTLKNIHALA